MDTRDKRASVLGLVVGIALVLPNPDGLALNQGDRQQTALCYRGIAASSPVVVSPETISLEGGYGFVMAIVGADGRTVAVVGSDGRTVSVEGAG